MFEWFTLEDITLCKVVHFEAYIAIVDYGFLAYTEEKAEITLCLNAPSRSSSKVSSVP